MARPRASRIAWIILRSLASGVIITIAISWAISAWMPLVPVRGHRYDQRIPRTTRSFAIEHYDGYGWNGRNWWIWDLAVLDSGIPWRAASREPAEVLNEDQKSIAPYLNGWGHVRDFMADPKGWGGMEYASGLPCVALWCGVDDNHVLKPWQASYRGGIQLSDRSLGMYRALPLAPVWSGFIIDTVIWGTIVGLAPSVAIGHRGRQRRRLGLCPACGYDRSGDYARPCPECGAGVKRVAQQRI